MSEDDIRKDFELTMVFGIEGIPRRPGCLERSRFRGHYYSNDVQAAWLGYLAAMQSKHAQLERFDIDRSIMNGMRTQFRELVEASDCPDFSDDVADRMMRAGVRVFGGTPA